MRAVRGILSSLLLTAPLLGGCVLPPAVTVASLAADGVSYAATGKSVTDHGISAATGQDCALLRELQGGPICAAETKRGKNVPVVDGLAASPPSDIAAPAPAVKDRYVVIGSFLSAENAGRAAASYAGLGTAIEPVAVKGRQFHRVVVGPLSAEDAAALEARLAADAQVAREAG